MAKTRTKALSKSQMNKIKAEITKALIDVTLPSPLGSVSSLTSSLTPVGAYDHRMKGKIYEASVLAELCRVLHKIDKYELRLVNGKSLVLNQKGQRIQPNDPHIEVYDLDGVQIGQIWMNVEFLAHSHHYRSGLSSISVKNSDYHELDIIIIKPHSKAGSFYPSHEEVLLGIECKCTKVTKDIIRSLLGLRRELSIWQPDCAHNTMFSRWSVKNSIPDSVLLLYSSTSAANYDTLDTVYDIHLENHTF